MQTKLEELFGIDGRSLAVLRALTASLILGDLILRARDLTAHYTDFGVLPRAAQIRYFANDWHVSIHHLSGTTLVQAILFALAGLAALAMLVGFRTRTATIVSWAMLVSLHNRNPMVLQGGDDVLRLMLFWGIFLPWGDFASVDRYHRARLGGEEPDRPPVRHLSAGTAGYLVQIASIYFFSVLLKTGPEWHSEGSAIYYALSLDQFRMPLGDILLGFPRVMEALTHATLWYEAAVPVLYFMPSRTSFFRTFTALTLALFHIMLGLHLRLGLFPVISAAATVGFLPSSFWEWRWPSRLVSELDRIARACSLALPAPAELLRWPPLWRRAFGQVLPAGFLVYIFVWNLAGTSLLTLGFTGNLRVPALLLRIDQNWGLFAPAPLKEDGWYVIPGELLGYSGPEDRVDVWRRTRPVSWEKPESVRKLYPSYRWRKYMARLWLLENEDHRLYFGRYLCRSWNRVNLGYDQLHSFELVYMLEETLPDGEAEPEPIVLWSHECFDRSELD